MAFIEPPVFTCFYMDLFCYIRKVRQYGNVRGVIFGLRETCSTEYIYFLGETGHMKKTPRMGA